jgi:hypothetical protein
MSLVSDAFANLTSWEEATTWEVAQGRFGPVVPAFDYTVLAVHANSSPTVLATITESDPSKVTFLHTPQVFLPIGMGDLDGHCFALAGNDADSLLTLRLPILPEDAIEHVKVRSNPTTTLAELERGTNGLAQRPSATATQVREVDVLPYLVMSTEDAVSAMQLGQVTLKEFHEEFIAPKTPATLAEMDGLLDWWQAAATPAAASPDHSVLERPIEIPHGSLDSNSRLRAWSTRTLRRVLAHAPTAAAVPLTDATFSTELQGLQRQILDATQASADRAAVAAAPTTYCARFGDAAGEGLRRLCGVPSVDDIPEVHTKIAANGNKNRHADLNVLEGAIVERAAQLSCVANTYTCPKATIALLNCFRGHSLTVADGSHGQGLSPFTVVCAGHPEAHKLKQKADQLKLLEQGAQAPSAADVRSYTLDVTGMPQDAMVASERLEAYSCVLDIFLGPGHPVAAGFREALQTDVGPHLRTRIRTQIGDGDRRRIAALRVMYWVHTHIGDYIESVQRGSSPAVPAFQVWAGHVRRGEYNVLPELPNSWVPLVLPPAPHSEVPAPAPSAAGTPGGARGGGAAGPAAGVEPRPTNPRPNAALLQRWRKGGLSNMNQLLEKRSDSTKTPKLGDEEACLTWVLRGSCHHDCRRKSTHKTSTPALLREVHDLLDHCGIPKAD